MKTLAPTITDDVTMLVFYIFMDMLHDFHSLTNKRVQLGKTVTHR